MFFVFIAVNGMCVKGNDCVCLPEWTGVNCQSGMNKNYPFTFPKYMECDHLFVVTMSILYH